MIYNPGDILYYPDNKIAYIILSTRHNCLLCIRTDELQRYVEDLGGTIEYKSLLNY